MGTKKDRLNQQQIIFVECYVGGMTKTQAYQKGYGQRDKPIKNTTASANADKLCKIGYIQDYIKECKEELYKKFDITKEKHIESLLKMVNRFEEMWALADKDVLTDEEAIKLKRLTTLLRAKDITIYNDQLARLTGFYEPDKVEVNNSWNISFGDEDKED